MRRKPGAKLLAIIILLLASYSVIIPGKIVHANTASSYLNGIDISHDQNYATVYATGHDIDWTQVEKSGINFVFVKATDGQAGNETLDVNYDSTYRSNMENGHTAGLRMGPYHYAEPVQNINDTNDAVKEANWFVEYAYSPSRYYTSYGLPPVLDFENDYCQALITHRWTPRNITNWVLTWMHVVETKIGISPILYTSAVCFTTTYFDMTDHLYGKFVTQYGVWVARYDTIEVKHPPTVLNGPYENWNMNWGVRISNNTWSSWNYWQYSSQGMVPGITGNVDLDYAAIMNPNPISQSVSQQVIVPAWVAMGSLLDLGLIGLIMTIIAEMVLNPYWTRLILISSSYTAPSSTTIIHSNLSRLKIFWKLLVSRMKKGWH